jgi:chemotaxis protein MotA
MMNRSSLIGIAFGLVLIVGSILIGGDIRRYFDLPSVMIVIGGVLAATIASYSFSQLKQAIAGIRNIFTDDDGDLLSDLEQVLDMAGIARREGLLALDGSTFQDPFLTKGVELIVDGIDSELVREILEGEISLADEQEQVPAKVLSSMAQYAPAFGMVGTLIGLINMLMFLSDASALGPSMATALITTFYGVILANLLFLPAAVKVRSASSLRQTRQEMLLEGILALQRGDNPRLIREKLASYIPAERRVRKGIEAPYERQTGEIEADGQTAPAS